MDYSQDLNGDDLKMYSIKIDSIAHTTAAEERVLWRKYIKWRHIKEIIGSQDILDDIPQTCSTIIKQIIKEISSSRELIILIKRHTGLDKLGDTIIEDGKNNANITIELYRLLQHSKKKSNEKEQQNHIETCCLEDFFGVLLGEILNNIAFGSGNPNLVDKITKAINGDPDDIEDKLYRLAINRELLPISTTKLFNPKIALNKLPDLIKAIPCDLFSEFALNDYRSFLFSIKTEGEKAFNRIIESHLWLVVDVAEKYINKDMGLPFDDIIQEGNLGLIEAAERFQPTLSTRFMQYAYYWIYQKITRAMADQGRTIRIPVHMVETINKLLQIRRRLTQEYGREPTSVEIAKEMGVSSQKIREIVKVSQLPISLESPIGAEEDNSLGDSIEDRNALLPVDIASNQLLKEQIEDVLSTLTPREARVLKLRFGLEDGRSRTLEEIGVEFNVTRERIRQIEAKALRKLRHPSRSRKLKEYLE